MQARAKNYLIILLALTTVTAGAVAWRETKRADALQSTLSANVGGKTRKTVAKSGSYSAVAATGKAGTTSDDNATADDNQNGNRQRRNGRANFEALMKDPKFAKAMATEQAARLNMRYGALYKQLNLSPDQQKALSSLLAERQNTARDVMDAARDQGLNPGQDRDTINQMIQQAQAQVDQNIQSTLGASGYSQYQQYQNSESQRNVVSDLNQALASSSTTLSTAQASFLEQALSSTGTSGGGGGPGGFGGGGQQATITDAVIAQAQGVLTSDQIAALQQLQAQQQAQQTMRQMFQAQAQANNNGN